MRRGLKFKGEIVKIIGVTYDSARVSFDDDSQYTYPVVRQYKIEYPNGDTGYVHPDNLSKVVET